MIQNLLVSPNDGLRTGHFTAAHILLKQTAALRLRHPDAWQGKGEKSTANRHTTVRQHIEQRCGNVSHQYRFGAAVFFIL